MTFIWGLIILLTLVSLGIQEEERGTCEIYLDEEEYDLTKESK